ncbi:unnamed protein product [Vitrella brassicaformis CCMP3155]|uniref:Uncharacterized protein n=1 Tax=Vitrella brassicaformis (strain CCMP3155) TaxID=1169540 RepID=A0A0G4F7F9_VITBC|nr:unnamed protein product [Vitrella brassicaformis CCMP3155]|eukprot:CEM08041.1 unnamed protein product [Vitrella brassicaformis CCMP3155]
METLALKRRLEERHRAACWLRRRSRGCRKRQLQDLTREVKASRRMYGYSHPLADHCQQNDMLRSAGGVRPPPNPPTTRPPKPSAETTPHPPLPTPSAIPKLPLLRPSMPNAATPLSGSDEAGQLNGVMSMHHGGAMGAMGGQFRPLASALPPLTGHYAMPPMMQQYRPVQRFNPARAGFQAAGQDPKANSGPPVPFWGMAGGVGDQPARQAAAGSPRMLPNLLPPPAVHITPLGAYAAVPHQHHQHQCHPAAHGGAIGSVAVPFGHQGSPLFRPSNRPAQEQAEMSALVASKGSLIPHDYGVAEGSAAPGPRDTSHHQINNKSASPQMRHQQQMAVPIPSCGGAGLQPMAHKGSPPPAATASAKEPSKHGHALQQHQYHQQAMAGPSAANNLTPHEHHGHWARSKERGC